jgi:plastocyanin
MKQMTALLFLCGLAVVASAEPTTHPVTITLGYDNGAKVCFVDKVNPMTVDADPGDKIDWTATDGSGQCANRAVKLANFKLKGSGNAKDPVPGCNKEMTSGGAALRCTITNAAKGETFKYDVDLPGGRGMDPEIRVRN